MRDLPKIHATVVHIPNPDDPESIAWAAANAAIGLLVQVSAEQRGKVMLDRLSIVHVESCPGMAATDPLSEMLGNGWWNQGSTRTGPRSGPGHAVMLTCRVEGSEAEPAAPDTPENTTDDHEREG